MRKAVLFVLFVIVMLGLIGFVACATPAKPPTIVRETVQVPVPQTVVVRETAQPAPTRCPSDNKPPQPAPGHEVRWNNTTCKWDDFVVSAAAPTLVPTPTNAPAPTQPAPAATSAPVVTNWKPDCGNIQVPIGYQVFWSNLRQGNKDPYAVIYDPHQGGSADHAAYGWYYQPCSPAGPERKAHEVAIVLHGGQHRFTGPECKVWQNFDGAHGWELGRLIIDRANVLAMSIAATIGAPNNEAWVAMKCAQSWAGGGSFERLEPMR